MFTDQQSLTVFQQKVADVPELALILGTGWNSLVDEMVIETTLSFEELFGVKASVPGHSGRVLIGSIADKRVLVMAGRIHMYEGYSAQEATLPIRVFANAGVKSVVLTAACGALNPEYNVGDFVVVSDVLTIGLGGMTPLIGPQFTDMSSCFDQDLRKMALAAATKEKLSFHEGVYAFYHGPSFESPTDKRAFRTLGADTIGMSTVPETIMAHTEKMKVLALGFITNLAFVKHSHLEVMAEAQKSSTLMSRLLKEIIVTAV